MNLLEEAFPNHKPLMPPAGDPQRPRADLLMRLERQFFSDWLSWLCNSWDDGACNAQPPACSRDAAVNRSATIPPPSFHTPVLSHPRPFTPELCPVRRKWCTFQKGQVTAPRKTPPTKTDVLMF
eukprot:350975-Chlamydomonas_euryale.AAC.2